MGKPAMETMDAMDATPCEKERQGGLIYEKICAIMEEIPVISKSREADSSANIGKKFRSVYDLMNHLQPLLARHGVFALPTVMGEIYRETRVNAKGYTSFYISFTVLYRFCARDGSSVEQTVPCEAVTSGAMSINVAMKFALKTALEQLFMIPTEASDNDDKPGWKQPADEQTPQDRSDPKREELFTKGYKLHNWLCILTGAKALSVNQYRDQYSQSPITVQEEAVGVDARDCSNKILNAIRGHHKTIVEWGEVIPPDQSITPIGDRTMDDFWKIYCKTKERVAKLSK